MQKFSASHLFMLIANPNPHTYAGGVSGTVSKTLTAPIERVKLIIQTQDANPKIKVSI